MLDPDNSERLRATVACALMRIDPQDKKALPVLLAMLRESQRETYESDDDAQQAADDARYALAALQDIGPSAAEAVPDVKKALQHRYAGMQNDAVAALAAIARKDAVPVLIEKLKEEKRKFDAQLAAAPYSFEESTRDSIVIALGKLGPEGAAAVPVLTAMLTDEIDVFLRNDAIESLGKMRAAAESSVPQLITMLGRDNDDTRDKAIVALGRIGPPAKAAVPTLLKVMSSDPDEDMREYARAAVQEIAPEAEPPARK
jgi:HEAT repeat protein